MQIPLSKNLEERYAKALTDDREMEVKFTLADTAAASIQTRTNLFERFSLHCFINCFLKWILNIISKIPAELTDHRRRKGKIGKWW